MQTKQCTPHIAKLPPLSGSYTPRSPNQLGPGIRQINPAPIAQLTVNSKPDYPALSFARKS